MVGRQSNQLPNNLPQLQNLIKRDPESYREEFLQQVRHFDATLKVFELGPAEYNKGLDEQVSFLSAVAKCYPSDLADFPQRLVDILRRHSTELNADMRMSLCRALILLRHKELLAPADLLQLFFDLLKCPDKVLRHFLRDHIVTDLKNTNAKHRDVRLNTAMQNFMFTMLKDSHRTASKMALDIMIELYKKDVWHDAKTVNVIATACFSDVTKLACTALRFFLGSDEAKEDSDDEDDDDNRPSVRDVKMANKVNKKTKKREKMLANIKKVQKKNKKKNKAESFNFSALHLVHDPQGLAERLFKRLEALKEKFEVKLLFLDLVSRLIGTHELFVLNFYPYIARFLQPHQREVVQMLQYSAQAAHELVPPDAVEPVLKAIVNNFVTERNSGEVMAIGLNAVRELCKRCPLVMDETLLRDLAEYKSYKDRAVMMAARSLIALFRSVHPELLHKKDRGRPTEATVEAAQLQYGQTAAKDFIPGAEAVVDAPETEEPTLAGKGRKRKREQSDGDSDSSGWEDVEQSDDEDDGGEESNVEEEDSLEERKRKAAEVTAGRILTDADFRKIDATQLQKQVRAFRKNKKRRTEDDDVGRSTREELVDLSNIEMIHKKRKHDREARMATILEGRKNREKFGSRKGKASEFASTTNKEKLKKKNFMMMKHKLKSKTKRSFVEKQKRLKMSLLRSRKFK